MIDFEIYFLKIRYLIFPQTQVLTSVTNKFKQIKQEKRKGKKKKTPNLVQLVALRIINGGGCGDLVPIFFSVGDLGLLMVSSKFRFC